MVHKLERLLKFSLALLLLTGYAWVSKSHINAIHVVKTIKRGRMYDFKSYVRIHSCVQYNLKTLTNYIRSACDLHHVYT